MYIHESGAHWQGTVDSRCLQNAGYDLNGRRKGIADINNKQMVAGFSMIVKKLSIGESRILTIINWFKIRTTLYN